MDKLIRQVLMKPSELNQPLSGHKRSLIKVEIQLRAFFPVPIFQRIEGSVDRAQRLDGNAQGFPINQAL
jgi:hypothetical protein